MKPPRKFRVDHHLHAYGYFQRNKSSTHSRFYPTHPSSTDRNVKSIIKKKFRFKQRADETQKIFPFKWQKKTKDTDNFEEILSCQEQLLKPGAIRINNLQVSVDFENIPNYTKRLILVSLIAFLILTVVWYIIYFH
jgi:hypothetical protein